MSNGGNRTTIYKGIRIRLEYGDGDVFLNDAWYGCGFQTIEEVKKEIDNAEVGEVYLYEEKSHE